MVILYNQVCYVKMTFHAFVRKKKHFKRRGPLFYLLLRAVDGDPQKNYFNIWRILKDENDISAEEQAAFQGTRIQKENEHSKRKKGSFR